MAGGVIDVVGAGAGELLPAEQADMTNALPAIANAASVAIGEMLCRYRTYGSRDS